MSFLEPHERSVVVCILTYKPVATLRVELLERTLKSIRKAFPNSNWCIINNGGNDVEVISELARTYLGDGQWNIACFVPSGNGSPGAGRNEIVSIMHSIHVPDLVVMSDDDMEWDIGAEDKLRQLWFGPEANEGDSRYVGGLRAPAIISGLLEPDYEWNKPVCTTVINGIAVLERESAPGAAWTFRTRKDERGKPPWPGISEDYLASGTKRIFIDDFGEDYEYCKSLRARGRRVAQIDLAKHIGWGHSTHGNEAHLNGGTRPLDRARWGV